MPLLITMLALRQLGKATQRQLAAVTGKNQSTVSRDLAELKTQQERARNDRNQPVRIYTLCSPSMKGTINKKR